MSTTRIYTIKGGPKARLVRAATRNQAVWHVASATFSAAPSTQDELEQLLPNGTKVEIAGASPQAEIDDGQDEGQPAGPALGTVTPDEPRIRHDLDPRLTREKGFVGEVRAKHPDDWPEGKPYP